MIVSIKDRATLVGIRPTLVAAYLRVSDWIRVAHEPNRYSIWARSSSGHDMEVLLPLDPKLADFAERMAELLVDLQRIEERSQLAILRDIETVNCDVYRFRENPPTSFLGTIPLDEGARLVSYARDFLLYGASAEHAPQRQSIAGRRPEEVDVFMRRALLGQTEASSFVVRAQVPIPSKQQEELFPDIATPQEEPFERRVGARLMTMLSRTREAAIEAMETNNYAPFSELLNAGATVGFYSTVVDAQEVVPSSPLEIGCTWAPIRPAIGELPGSVVFEPELALPIREAVRLLRPTVPLEGLQLIGSVELLHRPVQEEVFGELAMTTLIESRVRKVRFVLAKPEYDLAIRAFQERLPLAVRGDVVKEGRYWRLKDPQSIRVIEGAEEEVSETEE